MQVENKSSHGFWSKPFVPKINYSLNYNNYLTVQTAGER